MARRILFVLVIAVCSNCSKQNREAAPQSSEGGLRRLVEKEPNDRPEQALEISDSATASGALTAQMPGADEDWYLLTSSSPRAVDVHLTGGPDSMLAFEGFDADRNRLFTVTSDGPGNPVHVPNLVLNGKLYLRIYSPKKTPTLYTLTCRYGDVTQGAESEPNDRAADANPLKLGEPISGFLAHANDEDWYRLELPAADGGSALPMDGGAPTGNPTASPAPASPSSPDASSPSAAQAAAPDAGVPTAPGLALKLALSAVEGVRWEVSVLSAAQAVLYQARGKENEALVLRDVGLRSNEPSIFVVVKSAWIGTGKDARRGHNAEKAYTLTVSKEDAAANSEIEPNDELSKATPLALNGYRDGFLSPPADVDYYVVHADPPAVVRFSLSGVDRLDLVLSAVKPPEKPGQPEQVLVKVNDGALKEPEYLNNLYCAGDCWVKVEGALRKVDDTWVKDYENPDKPYRLSATRLPDPDSEEREPNNTPATATPVELGRAMRGTIHPKKDVDFFRLDLTSKPVRTPIKATTFGILKVDIAVYLYRMQPDGSASLVQTANKGKGDAPEVIHYSAEPGIYLLEIRDARNRESNFQDSYQLMVEEEGE